MNSYSARLAKAAAALAPRHMRMPQVPIRELALYDQDLDGDDAPTCYAAFRDAIARADGVLFVTPEYNRSVPGALKNAIDVASRPYGKGVIIGKPVAIVSQSSGAYGGFGANHAIRQSLVFLDSPVLQQPEAYVGNVTAAFGDDGTLLSDDLRLLLTRLTHAFGELIARSRVPLAPAE